MTMPPTAATNGHKKPAAPPDARTELVNAQIKRSRGNREKRPYTDNPTTALIAPLHDPTNESTMAILPNPRVAMALNYMEQIGNLTRNPLLRSFPRGYARWSASIRGTGRNQVVEVLRSPRDTYHKTTLRERVFGADTSTQPPGPPGGG